MREPKDTMTIGKKCPTCGDDLNGEWKYCPKCGSRVISASLEQQTKPEPVYESEADILVKEAKQLYFKRKYLDAVTKCKLAADMDNGEAYFMIGLLAARGHGGRFAKKEEAMTWYIKGSEKNNAGAINAIGVMYYKGNTVQRDIGKAITYFEKAAGLGDMFAPYNLARCYDKGIGVCQDSDKAEELLYLAIACGNVHAGNYYADTRLLDKDPDEPEEVKEYSDGFVLSKKKWGYLEKTYHDEKFICTILQPLYSEEYYKKHEKFIKKWEESYRRKCMYKLPELIIM